MGERVAVLAEQVDLVARARERLRERGVVDVGAGASEQVAVEDEDAHERVQGIAPGPLLRFAAMNRQRYRLRAPSTGREVILEGEPGRSYVDRDTGEPLQAVGKLLPLPPSKSQLPWAVENLRFCSWCDQPAQLDLNECPTCGRRMAALPR